MFHRLILALMAVMLPFGTVSLVAASTASASTCTLSKDASTPSIATVAGNTSGSISSASFTPPAGSLLVAVGNVGYKGTVSTAPVMSVTDSQGGTWTAGPHAYDNHFDGTAVFERYLPTAPGSLTVTFQSSNHAQAGYSLAVEVINNAAPNQAGAGASATGFGGVTGPKDDSTITTTAPGSMVFLGSGWSTAGNPLTADSTTNTLKDYVDSTDIVQLLTGEAASPTTTPGSETLGWNGSVNEYSSWAAQEVIPDTTCGTTSQAPIVTTNAASGVTDTGATLNGSVNPEGQPTTYKFDYGTSTSYGNSTTASDAGSSTSAVNETANLTGLQPSTAYHYRIEATNATGTAYGSDQTFTTSASSGPFTLAWSDNFPTDYPLGTFDNATENSSSVPGWGAYPKGWPDTATERGYSVGGHYDPGGTTWISGGQMHIKMFRDSSGDVHSSAMVPLAAFGKTYGKYVETFRVESPSTATGYKSAHLLYSTGSQNNEIDYPEDQWDENIYAFTHIRQYTSTQQTYPANVGWGTWHTTEIDWTPSGVTFFMDGTQIGSDTTYVPNTAMKWVLQNETALNGEIPAIGSSAQMDISHVAYYSYTP